MYQPEPPNRTDFPLDVQHFTKCILSTGTGTGRQSFSIDSLLGTEGSANINPPRHSCCWIVSPEGQKMDVDSFVHGIHVWLHAFMGRVYEHALKPLLTITRYQKLKDNDSHVLH